MPDWRYDGPLLDELEQLRRDLWDRHKIVAPDLNAILDGRECPGCEGSGLGTPGLGCTSCGGTESMRGTGRVGGLRAVEASGTVALPGPTEDQRQYVRDLQRWEQESRESTAPLIVGPKRVRACTCNEGVQCLLHDPPDPEER